MSSDKYFPLNPVDAEPPKGSIVTAAVMTCSICDVMIAGGGGPGDGSICWECGTLIRRGQVKMDREKVIAAYEGEKKDDR